MPLVNRLSHDCDVRAMRPGSRVGAVTAPPGRP